MNARLLVGDVRETLRELPDASVHCVVTSPPYWKLRDYRTGTWEGGDPACEHKAGRAAYGGITAKQASNAGSFGDGFRWECKCGAVRKDRQLGQEPELDCVGWAAFPACGACYVCHLVGVFREVRRILRPDGTLWLNLGDSSNAAGREGHGTRIGRKQGTNRASANGADSSRPSARGLKPKDTCLVPARVALALQADGWYLRRECIWAKGRSFDERPGSCMTSSVQDAPTYAHEQVFLFSKRERYYYDRFAVAEKGTYAAGTRAAKGGLARRNGAGVNARPAEYAEYSGTRNLRSVWVLPSENETAGHYATFPSGLPETCIKASTSERGVCAACGAPRVRVVESSPMEVRPSPTRAARRVHAEGRTACNGTMTKPPSHRTLGWGPSCGCGAEVVPATVLDPFAGLGKTGVVALRLGRSFIGCELSEAFARTAKHRLRRVSRDVEAPELPAPTLGGLFEEAGT